MQRMRWLSPQPHALIAIQFQELSSDTRIRNTANVLEADRGHMYTCVQASLAGLALDLGADRAEDTPTELDMWDPAYTKDTGPLVKGCLCFACLNHTRAYVHHLLGVHEMTAMVLLELHNTHQVLQFMDGVRAAIRESSFEQLRKAFAMRRQRPDSCPLVN